ncbi:MAG: tripartite tricarboxylate transporter permease [Gracilibacteraceae bacterium]|jgi:putative tricarboxylic transport membrane protein|nr:tripartite tricarboxylate transporter permease [Gracilibacteraceae bacterium]
MIDVQSLVEGFFLIFTLEGILCLLLGMAWGIVAGAIPGMTGTMATIILLPVTFSFETMNAMIMLTACYVGSVYAGSITAILYNCPGDPSSACTAFDGYPMAKKGLANEAQGLSLSASALGGWASYVVMLLFMKPIADFALRFGAPEMFMLAMFGMAVVASIGSDSIFKGVLMALFGLLLGTLGIAPTGSLRGTFGIPYLMDGIPFVSALIGLFAFTELFDLITREYVMEDDHQGESGSVLAQNKFTVKRVFKGMLQTFSYRATLIRGWLIGTLVGALPAAGSSVASLISYTQSKQYSKNGKEFGTGHPEGVVASESANNASTGGAMMTSFTIGIPGSATTAILLAALMMHGLNPGPRLFNEHMPMVYGLTLCVIIGNIVMLCEGSFFAYLFSLTMKIRTMYLVPIITLFCVIGSYSIGATLYDVIIMICFGVLGVLFKRNGYPSIAIVLGMILGPIADGNLIRTAMTYNGNFSVLFTSPICIFLLLLALCSVVVPLVLARNKTISQLKIDD